MLINFISNLPPDLRSGGFSAMNAAAFEALRRQYAVNYAGPVSLAAPLGPRLASKAMRMAGLPAPYAFYSERQLARFAAEAERSCDAGAAVDFFHGFTPWIHTRPARPYMAWSDCTFRDYVRHYNRAGEFRPADLARIERLEAGWLRGAEAIGFTSRWAADRAIADYALDPAKVAIVGIFGEAEMPQVDEYSGSRRFAFISTDFAAKGGPAVLAAFRVVRARHGDASLIIAGDCPPGAVASEPGVETTGFLRKEDPAENARLRDILATSRALVLPTKSDIAPLLLVEAGYFGCPVIASRRFAIGEIVEHGSTGLLLDDPEDVAVLANVMAQMLDCDAGRYHLMRQSAWQRAREHFARQSFEQRLLAMVSPHVAQPR